MRFSSLVDRLDAPGGAAWHIHHEARLAEARGEDVILLSVGDPDFDTPAPIVESAVAALRAGDTHYTPIAGRQELREAVARLQRRRGGVPTAAGDVMVVAGAQNGLFSAALCLLDPGDEVLVLEPIYATYEATLAAAGARVVRVAASPDDGFRPAVGALAGAVTPRTRAILLANPNNPSGVVMTEAEMAAVAAVARRHDLWVVADEVYESLVFAGAHRPFRALPGMAERTVKVGSAGKIFGLTGWKVGFVVAPPALMPVLSRAHQFLTFTTPPNLQSAVAFGLGKPESHFAAMRAGLQRSRDRLAGGLAARGFAVLPTAGTYFLNVDLAPLGVTDDAAFCRRLVVEHGVAAVPVSAFYAEEAVRSVVRFCFAKSDATLDAALERLEGVAGRAEATPAP